MRFFLAFKSETPLDYPTDKEEDLQKDIREVAEEFSLAIPENEFSMAELQGYLLEWKKDYAGALRGVDAWVERERSAKQERVAREQLRKEKAVAAKAQESYVVYEPVISAIGNVMNPGQNSRPHRSSSASASSSSGTVSGEADQRKSEDCDSPATGDQKQASRLPSNAMNGAKDLPWDNSISDVVYT